MTRDLLVSEMFGPTVQGEGPTLGRRCMFLRLGMCNLDCSWCDTPYTWDWTGKNGPPQDRTALRHVPVADVVRWMEDSGTDRLVITGGEPLIQQTVLAELVPHLVDFATVEVETNGTIAPSEQMLVHVDRWNVSPKLPHSGVDPALAWKPDVLRELVARAGSRVAIKVVCQSPTDVEAVAELAELYQLPRGNVWVMPEGRSVGELEDRMEGIADRAVELGMNVTTRLHVLAWGDRRGR